MGLHRTINQDMAMVMQQTLRNDSDSFSFNIPEGDFKFAAIVCDGLGGHANGEIASEIACLSFRDFVERLQGGLDDNNIVQALKQWFKETNEAIISRGNGILMCTTLTGILIYQDMALILNSGDSRTYRRRYGTIRLLTTDHSERLRTNNPDVPSSRIYNCLGIPSAFLDVKVTRVIAGDSYLICSDGLTGMISDSQLETDFSSVETLLELALESGGYDNITIISLSFSDKL